MNMNLSSDLSFEPTIHTIKIVIAFLNATKLSLVLNYKLKLSQNDQVIYIIC